MQRNIRGILFDIGDTLLPATELARATLEKTARQFAFNAVFPDQAKFIAAYQQSDADPKLADLPDLNHLYSDARIVSSALSAIGVVPQKALVEEFLDSYRRSLRSAIRPDGRLREALRQLSAMHLRLGIVSNGTTIEQKDQLQLLGVADLFSPIVISQDVGVRKPDPRIYSLAFNSWELPPSAVLVVGDRPDWEVEAPHKAGMKTALTVQYVDHRAKINDVFPDFIISNVRELCHVVGDTDGS